MKVILLHGKDTDPTGKWYPWFAAEMQALEVSYAAPHLPKADNPILDEWLGELDKLQPEENTVLIGHSRGGVAILRWLERQPAKLTVGKVILIAANSGFVQKMSIKSETNYGFYTEEGYNFNKIKSHCSDFVIFHSQDDPWVPYEAGIENATGLNAHLLTFDDRKHFGKGINSVPELVVEVKSALT